MKNPKEKGGRHERKVSVDLSKWLSKGQREDLLWRSATSGGRATVARKKGKDLRSQAGDISAIHALGQPFLDAFYIENKHYKNLEYEGLLTNTGFLVKFWKETVRLAKTYNKEPMLIAKQNHKPTVVFISRHGCKALCLFHQHAVLIAPQLNLHGFLFDDFVQLAEPPKGNR